MTAVDLEPVALDASALAGTWLNTNAQSRGIVRFDIAVQAAGIAVTAAGSEPWGTVLADTFSVDGFDADEALAFSAVFAFGFMEVRLQANIKGGVLVVAAFTRFEDESGRQHYFAREFYYRSAR
jgi:hypothetical protein